MSDAMSALKERECDYADFLKSTPTVTLKNYLIKDLPKEIRERYRWDYNNCYLRKIIFKTILERSDKILKLRNDLLKAQSALKTEEDILRNELNYNN